jgi:hypothetical protein
MKTEISDMWIVSIRHSSRLLPADLVVGVLNAAAEQDEHRRAQRRHTLAESRQRCQATVRVVDRSSIDHGA